MRGRRGRPPKTPAAAAPATSSPATSSPSTPAASSPLLPPGPTAGLRSRLRGSSRGRWAPDTPYRRPSPAPGGPGRRGGAAVRGAAGAGGGRRRKAAGGGSSRGGRRAAGGKAGSKAGGKAGSKVVYDDHESEEDDEEEEESARSEGHRDSEEEEEDMGDMGDSDYQHDMEEEEEEEDMEEEEDGSYCTDSSFRSHSTYSSTPGRRKPRIHRPRSPIFEEKDIPPLELPKSSEDLLLPNEHLLNVIAIYEVLRNFGTVLRLSPFRFEDFCAALMSQEQCTLMAETHVALLKAVLREEDTSNTTFGPADLKDSVNSTLYFIDGMTWPEVLRVYCESDKEYHNVLPFQEVDDYPYGPIESKVQVLLFLVDQFLTTNMAREELMSEGVIQYDDHCRVCHKLGDLLCCETCSAVYHLECVKPPLEEVPEDEWQCEVCVAHKVSGVNDCVAEIQKNKPYIRHEPIGYDRHRRKYWFLNRRIIVEEDLETTKRIWYYSSKLQLAELVECLDTDYWESDLCKTLEEMQEEIHKHMDITEDLTNKARGNNRSYLSVVNEELMEHVKAKQGETEENNPSEDNKTGEKTAETDTDKSKEQTPDAKQDASKEDPKPAAEPEKTDLEEPDGGKKTSDEAIPADSGSFKTPVKDAEPLTKESAGIPEDGIKVNEGETPTATPVAPVSNVSLSGTQLSSNEDSNTIQEQRGLLQESNKPVDGAESLTKTSQPSPSKQEDLVSGDVKSEKSSGDLMEHSIAGKGTPGSSRIVTRLRNPDSKLSLLKIQQVSAAVHEANKIYKEGREVLVVNSQGEISRLSTRKEVVMKGTTSNYFKLGQEGKYRVYHNQYSTNSFALNKHQHREDHDKRRHLSHKFCMSPMGEFKWNGSVHGSKVLTISTLRLTIIQLESNIPAPFLHPNWASHRSNWIKAVQMCSKPREFALALAILECAIKPVVMLPIWKDCLGHTRLRRMTSMEREEKDKVKKKERKQEEEESMQQATWVKYTFPVKHQVWKQKGEEYRVTGYGGWSWISKTHVYRFFPRFPGNTNVSYRKAMVKCSDDAENHTAIKSETNAKDEETKPVTTSQSESKEADPEEQRDQIKEEKTSEKEEGEMDIDVKPADMDKMSSKDEKELHCENDKLVKGEPMEVDEIKPEPGLKKEETFPDFDLINVSEGFQARTWYKKKVKTSRLDGLLERRVKQFTLEEKQRIEKLKLRCAAKPGSDPPKRESESLHCDSSLRRAGIGSRPLLKEFNHQDKLSGTAAEDKPFTEASVAADRQEITNVSSSKTLPVASHHENSKPFTDVPPVTNSQTMHKPSNPSNIDNLTDNRAGVTSNTENTQNENPSETRETMQSGDLNVTECHNGKQNADLLPGGTVNKVSSQICSLPAGKMLQSETKSQDNSEKLPLENCSNVSTERASPIPQGSQPEEQCCSENVSPGEGNEESSKKNITPCQEVMEPSLQGCLEGTGEHCMDNSNRRNEPSTTKDSLKDEPGSENTHGSKPLPFPCKYTSNGDPPKEGGKLFGGLIYKYDKKGIKKYKSDKLEIAAQINGKDANCKKDCLTNDLSESKIESKVNNLSKTVPDLEVKSSKHLMNGDISMESTDTPLHASPSADTELASEKDSTVEHSQKSSSEWISAKESHFVDSLCKTDNPTTQINDKVEEMETEGIQKATPSQVTSGEESSLSIDFNEQNGLTTESVNGVNRVKTVTEVITTTATISTSRTVVQVSSGLVSEVEKTVVSSTENTAVSSVTKITTVTEVSSPSADSELDVSVKEQRKTVVTSVTDSTTASNVLCSMTLSKEYSTKDRVRLIKFTRAKKTRSGTALPSYRKFVTKSSKKSIFVLPNDDLKKLSRRGGIREVSGFNYNAKPVQDIWPYPSPRPTFGITWRYRLQTVKSLAGVSLMLRLLWASLRWDDMAAKPPPGGGITRTETSETEITTTEIIKRRDVAPYAIRSEYCVRKIICPIGVPEAPKETPTPQRKGLRSSALRPKRPETPKQTGPIILETWIAEEELDLWEIKCFSERVEKEKAQAVEQQVKVSDQKKAEEMKLQVEAQLKQQRLTAQQKRLEQQKQLNSVSTVNPTTTSTTMSPVSTPHKVMVGSLSSPGTKVVLATKVGSPATVTFQQNKNFHQTFATWVKQGQTTTASSTAVTSGSTIVTAGQTFQFTGSPVTMAGKVLTKLPLPANSKLVAVNVPTTQGGVMQVQQKVLGIIPSNAGGQQTYSTFQPRTATVSIRPNSNNPGVTTGTNQQVITAGAQMRPGMTVIRSPLQQSSIGKAIIRTPLVVQQGILPSGQPQQVVTQIIRGQAVSTTMPAGTPVSAGGPKMSTAVQQAHPQATASQTPRPQQGQVKLTMAQLTQLTQGQGGNQSLTVVVQGQGQTTGQLQLIPQGMTVIPTPGQQLMQAAMPNGTIQRFLFTPLPPSSCSASTTMTSTPSSTTPASMSSEQKPASQSQLQSNPVPPLGPLQAPSRSESADQSQYQALAPMQPQVPAQPQSLSHVQPQLPTTSHPQTDASPGVEQPHPLPGSHQLVPETQQSREGQPVTSVGTQPSSDVKSSVTQVSIPQAATQVSLQNQPQLVNRQQPSTLSQTASHKQSVQMAVPTSFQIQAPVQTSQLPASTLPQSQAHIQTCQTATQVTVQSPSRAQLHIQPSQAQVITVPQLQQQVQVVSHLPPHVVAQLQAQQGGIPQHIKFQIPFQIQQAGSMQTHQIQNVVTVQGASVQEQLQRIHQLQEQQQQKKNNQEVKREQILQGSSQSEIIQKQVVMKQNAVIEHLKQKKTMTPVEREENQR
ncbi:nucleosome-remodeling factor subunit BPTF-like isoform X7 [Pelobates cultripes]|uniref:Nucleosome-remodeling factor subunit BPTF-like isoform X7 n=2 Tax=Pelobates cultripes TaxID=61616 RepID=A0AAD1S851_PELCU|nr:nucleosome-remodeling factor subunit BPTF-like isoform X7 [Pelobates cultripes]